jgi:hypothetical protein
VYRFDHRQHAVIVNVRAYIDRDPEVTIAKQDRRHTIKIGGRRFSLAAIAAHQATYSWPFELHLPVTLDEAWLAAAEARLDGPLEE